MCSVSPDQKGRSSRSVSSTGGREPPPPPPPEYPPPPPEAAPAATGAPVKVPPSSFWPRAWRLMTLSEMTSSDVRFSPSLPSNSRDLKRPSTKTLLPLRSCSAARSARSPKTLTRNQSVPSSTQPPWPSGLLWLTATLNCVTGLPLGVQRISGSRPRLPMNMIFENAMGLGPPSVDGGRSRLALGLVDEFAGDVLVLFVETRREILAVDVVELRAVADRRLGRSIDTRHQVTEDLFRDDEHEFVAAQSAQLLPMGMPR